jgi:hypothetical protein
MPVGSVMYETQTDGKGERMTWLQEKWLNHALAYRLAGLSALRATMSVVGERTQSDNIQTGPRRRPPTQ